jgi:hypothetical protein
MISRFDATLATTFEGKERIIVRCFGHASKHKIS